MFTLLLELKHYYRLLGFAGSYQLMPYRVVNESLHKPSTLDGAGLVFLSRKAPWK